MRSRLLGVVVVLVGLTETASAQQSPSSRLSPLDGTAELDSGLPKLSGNTPLASPPKPTGSEEWPLCGAPWHSSGSAGNAWVRAEWLFWATSGQPTFLRQTFPTVPFTQLFVPGRDRVNNDFRSGFRTNFGVWLDPDSRFGLEGDFFFVGPSGQRLDFATTLIGTTPTSPLSIPTAVSVKSRSELIGGGLSGLANLHRDPCGRLDFVAGYRYFRLSDKVTVNQTTTFLTPGFNLVTVNTQRFRASNDFHGGLIGLSGERRCGYLFVAGRASIAFGGVREMIESETQGRFTPPGASTIVLPRFVFPDVERSRFAVLPEAGIAFGAQLTDCARVHVGYNFLFLSNVVRAGDNLSPQVPPNSTTFWAQGISAGFEWRL